MCLQIQKRRASSPISLLNIIAKRKHAKKIDAELNQFEAIAIESQVYRIYDVYKIVKVIIKEWNFVLEEMKLLRQLYNSFMYKTQELYFKLLRILVCKCIVCRVGCFVQKIDSMTMDVAAVIPVITEVNSLVLELQHIETRMTVTRQ